jgi:hypothetical protein
MKLIDHVLIINRDYSGIQQGEYGYKISSEYLAISNLSPSTHDQLLKDAEKAENEGCFLVDFRKIGRCAPVPRNFLY